MLIPAAIVKVLDFHDDKGNSSSTVKEGFNKIRVMLDNGQIIMVHATSNNTKFSSSLKKFIDFKGASITKANEIKQAAYDIMFSDHKAVLNMLEKTKEKIKVKEPNLDAGSLGRKAGESVAQYLVSRKRTIASTSTIRLAFGTPYNNGPQLYNSRCIQVVKDEKGEEGFGNGGIYYFAQTGNVIPIEVSQIRKREGDFTGYFKVATGKLINANQINFLIEHSIRTIQEYMGKNQKPFLLQLLKHEGVANVPPVYFSAVQKLNQIEKRNRDSEHPLAQEEYTQYILELEGLMKAMKADKSLYGSFRASLPLVYKTDDMITAIDTISAEKGSSPLQTLPKAIANLNFSKEDPDIKKIVEDFVYSNIKGAATGHTTFKVLGTMAFSATNILGVGTSWGFPVNNIDSAKFTLSYDGTKHLIDEAYKLVDSTKAQKRG